MFDRNTGRWAVCLLGLGLLGLGCRTAREVIPRGPRLGDGTACEAAHPLHYRIAVVLDPKHRRLRASAAIELSCLPSDELSFQLNPHLFLEGASIEERRVSSSESSVVSPEGRAVAIHRLHYRGRSSEPVLVELRYEGKLRSTGTPLNELSEELIELSGHSLWYPRFAFAPPFTAELSIYAPSRFRIVALGRADPSLSVSQVDGSVHREWVWHVEEASSDLVMIGAPHLRSLDVVDRDERVTSYYSTLPSELVEVLTATLAQGRAHLREVLGVHGEGGASTQVFVPRSGPGYRSSTLSVISEETVRSSSGAADHLLLELSRAWWLVAEEPTATSGEEDALARYYAARVSGVRDGGLEPAATVILLRALERRVGREALDRVLRELRLRELGRPLRPATLDAALRHAFGAALIDALHRDLAKASAPEIDEARDHGQHQDREQ